MIAPMKARRWFLLFLALACGASGGPAPPPIALPAATPVHGYRIVREFPHDRGAFTQGLFHHDGFLYESTGLRGESTLRRVELESGRVVAQHRLLSSYFGEGSALADGRIHMLTWTSGVGFVHDADSFRLLGEFRYSGEGWGLTFDGRHLVMSDGTHVLRFRDPATHREVRALPVLDRGRPLAGLNELEWIEGEIWANIWTENRIARIDPDSGQVLSFVDLTGLLPAEARRPDTDVLNGIAWDAEARRLFVTGKKWPTLFEIEVVER